MEVPAMGARASTLGQHPWQLPAVCDLMLGMGKRRADRIPDSRRWDTVAIIGVGLIGGSIGLALRERKLAKRVVGIGRRKASLAKAQRLRLRDRNHDQHRRGRQAGRA